jgi:hypothetical protein
MMLFTPSRTSLTMLEPNERVQLTTPAWKGELRNVPKTSGKVFTVGSSCTPFE